MTNVSHNKHFEDQVAEFTSVMLAIRQMQEKANMEFLARLGNINLQQLNVLNVIGELGSCAMSEVANNVLVSLSSVTLIVNKLVEMGLVDRQHSKKDRRVVYVSLSNKGKEMFDAQVEHIREVGRNLLSLLNEDEQATFLTICRRFAAAKTTR